MFEVFLADLPNVVIPLSGYSVNYAGSITIPCTITAQPAVTSVQWKRVVNGLEQNIDTSLSKYSGGTTSTPALTISSAVQSDETFYICTATNSVGTGRSLQTYLDVLGGNLSYLSFKTTECIVSDGGPEVPKSIQLPSCQTCRA